MADVNNLKVGDTIDVLGKKISTLILKSNNFIVFLDESHSIEWYTGGNVDAYPPEFGFVVNEVRRLETINESIFKDDKLKRYNSLVAEGLARFFNERNQDYAMAILKEADRQIINQGVQKHRINYVLSSAISTSVIAILIYLLFVCKDLLSLSANAHIILTSSLFGGIGAFISTYYRSQNYSPDVSIKTSIHIFDGTLRIFYGLIAGTLVSLGIMGNVIFGFIGDKVERSHYIIAFLCLVAGASEFLIPNLIKQIEGKSLKK